MVHALMYFGVLMLDLLFVFLVVNMIAPLIDRTIAFTKTIYVNMMNSSRLL